MCYILFGDIMKIGFASDHRGYELKNKLVEFFKEKGYDVKDYGTNSIESCDYPDYAYLMGNDIVSKNIDFGIGICGSGIGISIALNKMNGVYCAKVNNTEEALHTRLDNNTNCVAFSGETNYDDAIKIIETFITTEFSNLDKHIRRIEKIKKIESNQYA